MSMELIFLLATDFSVGTTWLLNRPANRLRDRP
jgi:hypothetical protein